MIKSKISALFILIVLSVSNVLQMRTMASESRQQLTEIQSLSSAKTTVLTTVRNVLLWPVDNNKPGDPNLWRSNDDGNPIKINQNGEVEKTAEEYGMTIKNVTEDSAVVAPGDGEIVSLETLRANNKAEAFLEDIKDFNNQDTVVIKLSKLSEETMGILEYRYKEEAVKIYETIVPKNDQNLYILINNIIISNDGTKVARGEKIGTPNKVTKDDAHPNGTDFIYVKMFKENGELVEDIDKYISALYTKTDEANYKELKDKNEKGSVIDVPLTTIDGDYIVKTDMAGACPVITDKELLTKGIENWLEAPNQISNAKSILDAMLTYQEQYKVNLVFVYAVFKLEQGMGTAQCPPGYIPQSFNNWGSIMQRYDVPLKDPRRWAQFSSRTEMVRFEMYLFAEKGPYFKNKNYTVKTIGKPYCPPGDVWSKHVIRHMKALYKAMEVDAPLNYGDGSTPFLNPDSPTSSFVLKESGDGFSDVTVVPYKDGYLYYRNYKQYRGSYRNNPYSEGTVHSSGCGPTSIAIILSGYGIEASPGDTAKAMGGGHNGGTNGGKLKNCLEKYGLQAKCVSLGSNITQIKQILTAQLKTGRPISLSVHHNELGLTNGGHLIAVLDVNSTGTEYLVSNPSATGAKTGWLNANKLADAATGKYCVLVQTDPTPMSGENGDIDPETGEITPKNYPEGTDYTTALQNTLFIGDSYIELLSDSIKKSIPGAFFAGHRSQAAGNFLKNYDAWVEEAFKSGKRYDRIVVYLGVNEWFPSESEVNIDNMKKLIEQIKNKHPGIPIYVIEVMHMGVKYEGVTSKNKKIDRFNTLMKEYCNQASNVYYINTSDGLVINGFLRSNDPQGIHITGDTDNKKWMQNIANAIAAAN